MCYILLCMEYTVVSHIGDVPLTSEQIRDLIWDYLTHTRFANFVLGKITINMFADIVKVYEDANIHLVYDDITVLATPVLSMQKGLLDVEFRVSNITTENDRLYSVVIGEYEPELAITQRLGCIQINTPGFDNVSYVCTMSERVNDAFVVSTVRYFTNKREYNTIDYVVWGNKICDFMNSVSDSVIDCNRKVREIYHEYTTHIMSLMNENMVDYIFNNKYLIDDIYVKHAPLSDNYKLCTKNGEEF